jgi:hypothetical protein
VGLRPVPVFRLSLDSAFEHSEPPDAASVRRDAICDTQTGGVRLLPGTKICTARRLRFEGFPPEVLTLNRLADQLEHWCRALPPELRRHREVRDGVELIARVVASLRGGSKPGTRPRGKPAPERDQFLAWYDAEHAAGKGREQLLREAGKRYKVDREKLTRWLNSRSKPT